MNEHTCPVCGYDALEFPPRDYSICACCGTEFGFDDRAVSHHELRLSWIRDGFNWFDVDEAKPAAWSPIAQLIAAGFSADVLAVFRPLQSTVTTPTATVTTVGTLAGYRRVESAWNAKSAATAA